MKLRNVLYRNAQARDHLEIFLLSAITSLLAVRFYLYLTGYPQVGGGSLHIAHMLWGGLLMMAAIAISLSFLGVRAERLAALTGGLGFGVFIDELGKFITKDNNYFFRPTIGLIYALFCVLYLTFNFISRQQRLRSEEYQLNALRQFEEAVVHHMDKTEKSTMREYLELADPKSPITVELKALLKNAQTVTPPDTWTRRATRMAADTYKKFWRQRSSNHLVGAAFVVLAGVFVVLVLNTIYHNFSSIEAFFNGSDSYGSKLIIGQLVSSVVAAGFIAWGAFRLRSSRTEAFEWFRRAILVNLFLTEFFIFSRIQFGALPGFLINLALLALLHYALDQERRNRA